ncbi:MAG: hypothetical protein ACK2UC_01615 [Anaerolineae bacterium]|jgi:hypothetical protein
MKRKVTVVFVLVLTIALVPVVALAAKPPGSGAGDMGKGGKASGCTVIQDGILAYSEGHFLEEELLTTGFDPYGYNYQGHFFKGSYANVYLGGDGFPPYQGDDEAYLEQNPDADEHWAWPYRDVQLEMKWNDAWLSNKDCDGDGKLDRHYGYDSYIGSGAWETNHMKGIDELDGKVCRWNDFVKIVAVPEDADLIGDVWYTAGGTEIGPVIWGEFATIQEVYNDPCAGDHGLLYVSPAGAGLGGW